MTLPPDKSMRARRSIILDVCILLAVSLAAQAVHMSYQQGQAVICGDSAQHVDGAWALLDPHREPNFGFRKPGYTLLLAGIAAVTGDLGWPVIAVNYLALALLVPCAYGLGRHLHSRAAGWIVAIAVGALLQQTIWADRIMSEAVYTCLVSYGLLLAAVGLSRSRYGAWLIGAGVLLGLAWLTRAVGVAAIGACLAASVWFYRKTPRQALARCACVVVPVLAAVLLECGLNAASRGRFRTTTGGLGVMVMTRARFLDGSPLPDTPTTRRLLAYVPERDAQHAYLSNKLDGCVARWRAMHNDGLDDWDFNALILRSGFETIAHDPWPYLTTAGGIFVKHLLRQRAGSPVSPVPDWVREPIIVHPAAPDFQTSQEYWYAYWNLPHRSIADSTALVNQMRHAAKTRAPFGRSAVFNEARYLLAKPAVATVARGLRALGSIWPGFALILCGWIGLNRRTCLMLAGAYVLDAGIIAVCGATDLANVRYQFPWIVLDATLSACLITGAAQTVWARIRQRGWFGWRVGLPAS